MLWPRNAVLWSGMPIDWTLVAERAPAVISAGKNLVLAGAAVCTTLFAWKALSKWREETIGKRRLEIAEETLASFYQVREVIHDARTAMIWADEMVKEEGVPDDVVTHSAYGPMRRLRHSSDKIIDLRSKRHRFAAVFGIDRTKPWDTVEEVMNEMRAASDALLHVRHQDVRARDPDSAFYVEQRKVLARSGKDDPIAARIDAAIAEIEAICTPLIRASTR